MKRFIRFLGGKIKNMNNKRADLVSKPCQATQKKVFLASSAVGYGLEQLEYLCFFPFFHYLLLLLNCANEVRSRTVSTINKSRDVIRGVLFWQLRMWQIQTCRVNDVYRFITVLIFCVCHCSDVLCKWTSI